jgi:FkbM family methyltransferase
MLRQTIGRFVPRGVKAVLRPPAPLSPFQQAVRRFDPETGVVFDIGANVGDMTLSMLEAFPQATIYAFEPCSDTHARLAERVKASRHGDRVKLFTNGFFDQETVRALNVTSFNGANSLLEITPEYHQMNPHIEECTTEDITLVRLDDFVVEQGINQIDLIKIDVEGAEYQVLAGGRETLSTKVDAVIVEVSFIRRPREDGEFIRIFQILHECGFAPAEIYDVEHADVESIWRLAQFDCVFRRIKPLAR